MLVDGDGVEEKSPIHVADVIRMSEIISSSREKISAAKLYDRGSSPAIRSCLKPGARIYKTAGGSENNAAVHKKSDSVATGSKRVRFDL